MEIKQVEFQFKGARNYIQGPDLFNAMIDLGSPLASLHNIRFIAHQFVDSPICEIYVARTKEELNQISEIHARCQLDVDRTPHWIALKPYGSDKTGKRGDYDEARLISYCRLEGEKIRLSRPSPFTFIETIVSMNKHLHHQLFPDVPGKWIFTRVDLDSGCNEREHLELHFKHNMNYRLTKSDILVNGQKLGDLYFSLVKA
ncbi:MAG: hypothetical protein ACR65R_10030 [Methylomicrobium sp.]